MEYPDWVPESILAMHKKRTSDEYKKREFRIKPPDELIDEIEQIHNVTLSKENAETLRKEHYRRAIFGGLSDDESLALLEKLIFSLNMKGAWTALSKRHTDNRTSPWWFFTACDRAICGWRGSNKRTTSEHKAFYQEIVDTAIKLNSLLRNAEKFDGYSISQEIDDESIHWLIDVLDIHYTIPGNDDPGGEYVRYCISEVLPSVPYMLDDIAKKAMAFKNETVIVKKPNSQNAQIHYFIRFLSDYCQSKYGQPLHDVVATTTSVVYDLPNCDDDYVRKIVAP
ncbi:hypothetical protein [Permianibacter aggregans]|uniref:Uncharacterized protein n=1 Tax=Permianibacter aggregans TaxID=1510150 RepID=A0A4R6UVB8_9GAMM|nr:hypothetical protein [Permianibacter aggregans]QGX39376.1 hypothetical protein E2H98_06775 [Permianibacter aggregans]TDQ49889.1 hypothetical protein EV696_103262 [Permianibacter aggregans]